MHASKTATIVDVRTPDEFAENHFPDALTIPLDQVSQWMNAFKEMPEPIIVYCSRGNRSSIAVSILKQNGIANAVNGGSLDDLKQNMR